MIEIVFLFLNACIDHGDFFFCEGDLFFDRVFDELSVNLSHDNTRDGAKELFGVRRFG